MRVKSLLGLVTVISLLFQLPQVGIAAEASFPTKPIKLIVPFAAGSGTDMEARGLAPFMEKYLKVRVAIEDIAGAGGKLGLTKAWKSDPDGYTLLYHIVPGSITTQYMLKAEYDVKEFTHIYAVSKVNVSLTVPIDSWKTFDEFLKTARSQTVTGGCSAMGGTAHLQGLAAAEKLGMKINWVPYEGGAEALAATAGKHLSFALTFTTTALPLVNAKKLRPLLVFSDEKDNTFPETPTTKQLEYDIPPMSGIRGIVGPAKIPSERAKILEEAMVKLVKDPEYHEWAKKNKMEIVPLSARDYHEQVLRQYEVIDKYKHFFEKPKEEKK